jgi:hypothetical protein
MVNILDFKINSDNADNHVNNAFAATMIIGIVTLIMTLVAIFITPFLGFNVYSIGDVIFIFLLAYGIWKRNRIAAALMPIYFALSKIIIAIDGDMTVTSAVIGIFFELFLIKGAIGTFVLHKKTKHRK